MSRSNYGHSTLSGLVGSDSEDATLGALDAISTPESARENVIPSRKVCAGSKGVSGKIMKAKASGRRISGTKATVGKKGKRAPLSDKTNKQYAASDTEEVDEFEQQDVTIDDAASGDELDASLVAIKQKKPQTSRAKISKKVDKAVKEFSSQNHDTDQYGSPGAPRIGSRAPIARSKPSQSKRQQSAEPKQRSEVVQETQRPAVDMDDYGDEDVEEPTPKPIWRYTSIPRAASQTRQTSVPRRRAGSVSDTERNDPVIRRKLGEMTKKLENLDLKYRTVREIGIKEAEHNFERLKKQSEESKKGTLLVIVLNASLKSTAANDLIASLKADLAAQSSQLMESRDLKKLVDTQAADISRLQAKVAQLTASLSDANVENKTLSAKLAANRNLAAFVESANGRGPGSAVKANGGIRLMGSAEVAQAAQTAQLKEDLYSDLTGLIIRDVKREAEDDVYDCIQTGRNGSKSLGPPLKS